MMMMITWVSQNLCWSTFPTIDALLPQTYQAECDHHGDDDIGHRSGDDYDYNDFFHDEHDSVILLIKFN